LEKLSKERIEEITKTVDGPVKVYSTEIGTVIIKRPDEDTWDAYETATFQAFQGKRKQRDVKKNLVCACVVYPTAVELAEAIAKSGYHAVWSSLSHDINEWCGGDVNPMALGNG
jgi:hypothetical protein